MLFAPTSIPPHRGVFSSPGGVAYTPPLNRSTSLEQPQGAGEYSVMPPLFS